MKLYPHQVRAVDWLAKKFAGGAFGALLLDEQGLGKTATAIMLAERMKAHRVLCIVPAAVLWNWEREWSLWAPGVAVQVITTKGDLPTNSPGVVIMTHGRLLDVCFMAHLTKASRGARDFFVIIDEAQAFKTPSAKRTRALYGKLPRAIRAQDAFNACGDASAICGARHVLALSGTITPNNPSEIYTHVAALSPERLPETAKGKRACFLAFRAHFCHVGVNHWGAVTVRGNKRPAALRKMLRGFGIRRRLREVLPELPPVRHEQIVLRPDVMPDEIQELDALLTPTVVRGLGESNASTPAEGFKALGDLVDLARFRRLCGLAKVDPIVDLVRSEMLGRKGKLVIVCQHHDVIDLLAKRLSALLPVVITGKVPPKKRAEVVDLFQNDARYRVAICQVVAGGVGITLTAASEMLIAELPFVPGELLQACSRIDRIGQTKPVRIRFVSLAGTVDVLLASVMQRKTQMLREINL